MEIQTLFDIINHSSSISVILPLACGILKFKTLNTELRVLFLYIILSALAEGLGFIFIKNNIQTYLVNNIFTVVECTLLTYIYLKRFELKSTRIIIRFFNAIFYILAFYVLALKGRYDLQDSVLSTYEAGFLIALASGYIIKVMREINISRLKEAHFTWINVGILIYFSMAILLFLFYSYIEKRGLKTYNNLYSLHWITNIGYNILLATGIWKIKAK